MRKNFISSNGFVLGFVLMLAFATSCQKEDIISTSSTTPTQNSTPSLPSVACGEAYTTDLTAGQHIDAGSVIVFNDTANLYVVFSAENGWTLGKTHLYVGSLANMPTTPNGNPKIGNFPYQHTINPMATRDTFAIPLDLLDSCFIIAAHAEAHLLNANGGIIQSETAWGSGTQMNTSGSWAMYFSYCEQICVGCQFAVDTFDIFAGQTIPVGNLLVTNDEDSVYVTYQFTGDWFIGGIHLYVGDLAGLPVNNQNTPVPGQFPYNYSYNPMVQSITIAVPLAGLPACYVIAAHAEAHRIVDGTELQSETAWSFGDPFAGTSRWGWTSPYCTKTCE